MQFSNSFVHSRIEQMSTHTVDNRRLVSHCGIWELQMGSVGLDWRQLCELMGLIWTDRQIDKQTHGKGGKNGVRERRGEGRSADLHTNVYTGTQVYTSTSQLCPLRGHMRETLTSENQ